MMLAIVWLLPEGSSPDEVRVAVERGVESLKRAKYLMDMDGIAFYSETSENGPF